MLASRPSHAEETLRLLIHRVIDELALEADRGKPLLLGLLEGPEQARVVVDILGARLVDLAGDRHMLRIDQRAAVIADALGDRAFGAQAVEVLDAAPGAIE